MRERLLKAWLGEIEAGRVYDLIARRLDDRRAEIMRRMAEAEGGHRRRLEARMEVLGIPVPDPSSVRLSPWLRLQARIAPIDRLLAAREAGLEPAQERKPHRRRVGHRRAQLAQPRLDPGAVRALDEVLVQRTGSVVGHHSSSVRLVL